MRFTPTKALTTLRRLSFLCLFMGILPALAFASGQVELVTDEATFIGKPIAHNLDLSWLAHPDGSLSRVELDRVTSFRKFPEPFRVESAIAMRTRLQRELGRNYEVVTGGPFVVAGPVGRTKHYAKQLDELSRSFSKYVSTRRLPTTRIEYPLLVQIYTSRAVFDAHCAADNLPVSPLLRGYYHPRSNRISLFEDARPQQHNQQTVAFRSTTTDATLPPATVQTLLHEGIHQLAFNSGLHSRIRTNPRWVVEGFAEVMEGGTSLGVGSRTGTSSTNLSRLKHFQSYRKLARQETIADFIANDELYFRQNVLNAYSQAWALSYFLAETRPSQYSEYLNRMASRDPLAVSDSPKERLTEFQAVFGKDIDWLEVQFLRFIDQLKSES